MERTDEQPNRAVQTENRAMRRNPWFSVFGSWCATLGARLPSAGAPLVLVALGVLLCFAAYQPRFALHDRLTHSPTNIRISGTYPVEGLGAQAQRWTSARATLRFSGIGAGAYTLQLRFHGGAEAGAGRVLTVSVGGLATQLAVRSDWQTIQVAIPPDAIDRASGDLVVTLAIPAMQGMAGDPRQLGVALQDVAIQPSRAAGAGFAPLASGRALQLAATTLLLFFALRIVGLPTRGAFGVAASFGLLLAAGLATARMDTAQLLDLSLQVLPWTLALAIILRIVPFGTKDERRRTKDQRHVSSRFRLSSFVFRQRSSAQACVCCAVLAIFTLRLGGLLHPQYINIDQGLRANQLVNIASGRADVVRPQLEQQYEWGTREPVPYSLLTYDLLVPLTWFWRGDDLITAMETTSVLLDATVPLLLWALMRQRAAGGEQHVAGERAAAFAGWCYAALPVGYLFFHDGSFPTTIGIWFALVALVAVRALVAQQNTHMRRVQTAFRLLPAARWLLATALLALALVAYVTQIAFVGFLVAALIGSLWLLGGQRQEARWLALALGAALVVDWLVYYRDYTATLIQRTIPAFASQIVEHGSVGHDTGLLYNTAVNSFSQHLDAHFRVWPVLLAGTALLVLLVNQRHRFATHLGLAYALFFGVTALAERWFGLWNKHMVFAAPGVALLAGVGLAWLWGRGRAGQVVCVVLLAFLGWSSTLAWGNRALWYVLPPSAL